MNQLNQWGAIGVIVGGYLPGLFLQNRRLDDFRDSMNRRFDHMNSQMNKRFDDVRDLLKSEIKRVEDRIERLDHPIVR